MPVAGLAFSEVAASLTDLADSVFAEATHSLTPSLATRRYAEETDGQFMYGHLLRVIALGVAGAAQHAEVFGRLLGDGSNPLPTFTVARAGTTAAARTGYLVEPNIEARERLRRAANDVLYALSEVDRILVDSRRKILHSVLTDVLENEEQIDRIVGGLHGEEGARAEILEWGKSPAVGFQTLPKGRGGWKYLAEEGATERRPSDMEAIERILGRNEDGWRPGMGAAFFQTTSSVMHSSAHGLAAASMGADATPSEVLRGATVDGLVANCFAGCLVRLGHDLGRFGGVEQEGWEAATDRLLSHFDG